MKRFGICIVAAALLLGRPAAAETVCCTALAEARTGALIGGTNAEIPCPAGSQTKLMTVLLTAEAIAAGQFAQDTLLTVPPSAEGAPGATVWLRGGEKMSAGDLLKAVIIGNANDACIALACAVSGSEETFVQDMNAEAFTLGMRQTCFADCTGISPENNTSARDMTALCRALLEYDFLRPYFTTWRDFLREGETELVSENKLTRGFEGLLGLKAGHGDASGYTLCLAAEREQMRLIAVVLGCDDTDERFQTAKGLLADGFSGWYVTTPDISAEFMRPLKVRHGISASVTAEPETLCAVAAPKGVPLSTLLCLPQYAEAPVRQGQVLGSAAFYSGDSLLCEIPMTAAESVPVRDFRQTLRMLVAALFKS